jgi:chondroitin AC lyase
MAKRSLCIALLLLVNCAYADDGSRLRHQFIDWHTRGAPSAQTIKDYVRRLTADGAWPDIDYTSDERGGWPAYSHLGRTLAMAEAYRKPDHPLRGDTSLRDAIIRSLSHWTEDDYVCPNWWYPQIGVPMTMAPILILMGDQVPTDLRQRTIGTILGRSKMGMTGQNKVWLAGIAFMKGMLADDSNLMAEARDQIFSELHLTTAEGIQPDYSFHQHGPQQQWGNYGAAFGSDMIEWASILRGTEYALEPQRLEVLRQYLLEGSAWIVWEGRMDISGCGRQIFRRCQVGKGRGLLRQLELMTSLDPSEADRYAGLIASNEPDGANTLVGHKHFWRSDMSVHRRPGWYASVKMSSTRVIGAETCNSENMLGLHLGDGVTYFLRTGDEYEDLFPVWDWRRLPGTTCRQDQDSLVPSSKACRGRSEFVGGVTNGTVGVAALEYIRAGLRARKTWFFLDEAVICLGAGIDSDQPEPVLTSINQCARDGPVTICADQGTRALPRGEHTCTTPDWVHHDGVGYVFLAPAQVHVGAGAQRGTWYAVHHRESRRTVERDVFSLWIDHGARPQGRKYAYAVLPGVTVSAMPGLSNSLQGTVFTHTGVVQAISAQDGKLICAAFFETGRLTCEGGFCIEVDVPCLLMFDRTSPTARLYVADPTHRHKQISLRFSGAEYTVDLPAGGLAGKTTTLELP